MLNNLLYKRRSTRKFLPKKVEDVKTKSILSAALLAPSSKNSRPWEFIVVDDPDLLGTLSLSKPHGSALLKHAPLAIVIMGDKNKSDVWIEDCSIASILIQMEAEALGLGSCWVQIHRRFYNDDVTANEYIHEHLNIPENLEVLSIVGIGYKAVEKSPLTEKDLQWDKVSMNRYRIKGKNSIPVIETES
jgi:nitroreductase